MLYPVAIYQKKSMFYAHFPDIPELEIKEKSMADTISTARQALIDYLKKLFEDGLTIPEATDLNTHLTDSKYAGWTWAIVNIDLHRIIGEEVIIKVKIPQRLNKDINNFLQKNDILMNDFLISAIKDKIEKPPYN